MHGQVQEWMQARVERRDEGFSYADDSGDVFTSSVNSLHMVRGGSYLYGPLIA